MHREDHVGHRTHDRRLLLLQLAQAVRRLRRAQHVAHPMAENRPVDRLGDEVVGARLVGPGDRVHVVHAGDHDHRHLGRVPVLANAPAYREAVDAGHVDVEQHQVRRRRRQQLERRFAVRGFANREAELDQRFLLQHAHDRIVVDDQQPGPQRGFRRAHFRDRGHSASSAARACAELLLPHAASSRAAPSTLPLRPIASSSLHSSARRSAPTLAQLDFSAMGGLAQRFGVAASAAASHLRQPGRRVGEIGADHLARPGRAPLAPDSCADRLQGAWIDRSGGDRRRPACACRAGGGGPGVPPAPGWRPASGVRIAASCSRVKGLAR